MPSRRRRTPIPSIARRWSRRPTALAVHPARRRKRRRPIESVAIKSRAVRRAATLAAATVRSRGPRPPGPPRQNRRRNRRRRKPTCDRMYICSAAPPSPERQAQQVLALIVRQIVGEELLQTLRTELRTRLPRTPSASTAATAASAVQTLEIFLRFRAQPRRQPVVHLRPPLVVAHVARR